MCGSGQARTSCGTGAGISWRRGQGTSSATRRRSRHPGESDPPTDTLDMETSIPMVTDLPTSGIGRLLLCGSISAAALAFAGCKPCETNLANRSGDSIVVRLAGSDQALVVSNGASILVPGELDSHIDKANVRFEYPTGVTSAGACYAVSPGRTVFASIDSAGRIFIDDAQHSRLSKQLPYFPKSPRVTRITGD